MTSKYVASHPPFIFVTYRLNADGSADSTFGNAGRIETSFGDSLDDRPLNIKVLGEGKIIASGYLYTPGIFSVVASQYNADGTLDSTFDINGKLLIPGAVNRVINSTMVQDDGKIIAGGFQYDNSNRINNGFLALRFNVDGSPDSGFGTNGVTFTKIVASDFYGQGEWLTKQEDGKVILAGQNFPGPAGGTNFSLVRYKTDGRPDSSFSGDGIANVIFALNTTLPEGGNTFYYDDPKTVHEQPDKSILAAGQGITEYITPYPEEAIIDHYNFYMLKFKPNGTLDSSFGIKEN